MLYGRLKINETFLKGCKTIIQKNNIKRISGKIPIAMLLLNWLNLDWHCYSVRFHWSMRVSSSCIMSVLTVNLALEVSSRWLMTVETD